MSAVRQRVSTVMCPIHIPTMVANLARVVYFHTKVAGSGGLVPLSRCSSSSRARLVYLITNTSTFLGRRWRVLFANIKYRQVLGNAFPV